MLQQGVNGYGHNIYRKSPKDTHKAGGNFKKRGAVKANPAKKRRVKS